MTHSMPASAMLSPRSRSGAVLVEFALIALVCYLLLALLLTDDVLPFDRKVVTAANTGRPVIQTASTWWGYGKPMWRMIGAIAACPR